MNNGKSAFFSLILPPLFHPLHEQIHMPTEDYTDRAIRFMEQLDKLRHQLSTAQEQQRLLLSRMIELKNNHQTNLPEYEGLSQRSKNLQAMIDKWRPIYLERLQIIKDIKASHR